MQIFASLAELGSFKRTAEAAQIGRPQVTQAIQELETALGVRLFHRTTRKVNLTAEGEVFYERVTAILGDVAEATSLFASNGENARGRLRIDQIGRAHVELQSLMRISYAVFCWQKQKQATPAIYARRTYA